MNTEIQSYQYLNDCYCYAVETLGDNLDIFMADICIVIINHQYANGNITFNESAMVLSQIDEDTMKHLGYIEEERIQHYSKIVLAAITWHALNKPEI